MSAIPRPHVRAGFDPRAMAVMFGELLDLFDNRDKALVSYFCRVLTWYRLANVVFQACCAIIKNVYQCSWEQYKEVRLHAGQGRAD